MSITKTREPAGRPQAFAKALPWILVIGGAIGLICALIISIEKIHLLENPSYSPPCDLNPVISCGSVMKSAQAHAFSFPNPFIGLAAFGMLVAAGASLLAGGHFRRWWWLSLQAGAAFGLVFVHWLFFQSVYRIGSLCPYCMVVWVVTITTFWYALLYNLGAGHIRLPLPLQKAGAFAARHHLDILIAWLVLIALLILQHFWYYYGKFL
jgi:uncharacterized membrane protein